MILETTMPVPIITPDQERRPADDEEEGEGRRPSWWRRLVAAGARGLARGFEVGEGIADRRRAQRALNGSAGRRSGRRG